MRAMTKTCEEKMFEKLKGEVSNPYYSISSRGRGQRGAVKRDQILVRA
jgi:hypothetical protein